MDRRKWSNKLFATVIQMPADLDSVHALVKRTPMLQVMALRKVLKYEFNLQIYTHLLLKRDSSQPQPKRYLLMSTEQILHLQLFILTYYEDTLETILPDMIAMKIEYLLLLYCLPSVDL